jgi:hypothetical protein
MRLPLPDGGELIPHTEFAADFLGGVTPRTVSNYERRGLPTAEIGGKKYVPLDEGLAWIAAQIKRRNPPRHST